MSSTIADVGRSVRTLSAAKIPLSSEVRVQLADTRTTLSGIQDAVDDVMDQQEKRILVREMPSRNGPWRFSFDKDKITDEERVQASTQVENSQAKYDLAVTCGRHGGEFVITTFEPVGTDAKRIPWGLYSSDRRIQLRIDLNPAFGASLEMRGYVNQGQVRPADIRAQFKNLVHSSRLVFADVFPDEQVEVATAYPPQFGRLCELISSR